MPDFRVPPFVAELWRALRQKGWRPYFVGGYVRDLLIGRESHDLDLIVDRAARRAARYLADQFGGAYYDLDAERDFGRAILPANNHRPALEVDITPLPDGGIEADLAARDFTINAIALTLAPTPHLVDPFAGAADLQACLLRPVTDAALANDPVRLLRAVRFALDLHCHWNKALVTNVEALAPQLSEVGIERLRDEWHRILGSRHPAGGLVMTDRHRLLPQFLPELTAMHGVQQPLPHVHDLFLHTVAVLRHLGHWSAWLAEANTRQSVPQQMAVTTLQPWRTWLAGQLNAALSSNRSRGLALRWSALLHDVGKISTGRLGEDGRLHFIGHELAGAALAGEILTRFRLSRAEIAQIEQTIRLHMRLHDLFHSWQQSGSPHSLSRRALYRFFRDAEPVFPELLLLYWADVQGTYGHDVPETVWSEVMAMSRYLLHALREQRQTLLPTPLLDGRAIMTLLRIGPGPAVGAALSALREAQSVGDVTNLQDAQAWLIDWWARQANH